MTDSTIAATDRHWRLPGARELMTRYGILITFVGLIVAVGIGNDRFLTARNWSNLLD